MRIVCLVFCLMLSSVAWGQTSRPRPAVTGNIVNDIKTDIANQNAGKSTATTNTVSGINFAQIGQKLQAIAKDVLDKAIADTSAASADAQVHNDKIAQPCWDAQTAFFKSLPIEQQNPPTEVGPALAIQISRDLLNTITGNDATSLKVACAALIGDQLTIINQTLALVGVAGITGLPAGL